MTIVTFATMTTEATIVLATLFITLILMVWEKIPPALVSLCALLVLGISGILTPEEVFGGFSHPATVTIAAMFVLSAAMSKSGYLEFAGAQIGTQIRQNSRKGIFFLLVIVALFSSMLNNTPVVAAFIPVVIQACRSARISPSKVLIPMSFAAIFGGMCTLIGTSTNIVVSGVAIQEGLPGLSMFQMTPLGVVLVIAGIGYLMLFGDKLLPKTQISDDLKEEYAVNEYITELTITDKARSVNMEIFKSPIVANYGMQVIEVVRDKARFVMPPKDMVLKPWDNLKVRCDLDRLREMRKNLMGYKESPVLIGGEDFQTSGTSIVELMVPAESQMENTTLKELDFRRNYRGVPLAIRHRESVVHANIEEVRLKGGDVILAEMKTVRLEEWKETGRTGTQNFMLLNEEKRPEVNKLKVIRASVLLLMVVVFSALGWLSVALAAGLAVVVLLLVKDLHFNDIQEGVNWRVIFLLAGMLSLAQAMHKTGLDLRASEFLSDSLVGKSPLFALGVLYIATALLTEVLSNNAAAALMAPIAIGLAQTLGYSPTPFLLAIAIAASASFLTPLGYQTNTMVYSAGGYRFKDFFKVGLPLTLLFAVVSVLVIPLLYPF